jgi:type IV pilus assembly protein PilY1
MSPLSTRAAHAQRTPFIKRLARVLAPVVIATTTVQPLAFAAPSPSLLEQRPRFVDVSVDSNVAFILDDSLSMEDIRLPVPAGLDPGESAGGTVTVRGAATGFVAGNWVVGALGPVARRDEWIHRSSALNPLYYNPEITYRPWNDNRRAGAAGNFTNAPVGSTAAITDPSNRFRFGITPHDQRYVGPNFEFGVGNNFARRLPAGAGINAGANPPAVPAYLAGTRAAAGGFAGVNDGAATPRNQDLFTSPMVLADGGAQQCLVPTTAPILTSPPSTPRGSASLPWSMRTTVARPSDPLPTQSSTPTTRGNVTQPTQARLTFARPIALDSYTATVTLLTPTGLPTDTSTASPRPSTPRPADTTRAITTRPSSTVPSTTRTTSARPSTPILTSSRPSSPAPREYRQEQGVCGTWGPWTTSPPAQSFCSDPNSEGGVRVALIESNQLPCPSGTTTSGSQCLGACPTGQSVNPSDPTQCTSVCSGTVIGSSCYTNCPLGTSIFTSDPEQCISDCASGTPSGTQCVGSCATGEALISGRCYSSCPSDTTIHSTTTQCIATCPSGTTQTATQCLGQCPSSHPTQVGSTCYVATCTGTDVVNPSNPAQCLTACPAGTTRNSSNQLQCLGTCPSSHPFQSGTQCYQVCPAGTRNPSNPAQCLTCPTGGTLSGTQCEQTAATCPSGSTLIGGRCYADCPADTNGNPTAPFGSPATQCRTTCPADTLTSNATICRRACPGSHPSLSGSTCYADCPAGSAIHPSNVAQCLTDCSAGFTRNAGNPLQCDGSCTGSYPTRIGSVCYGACGPDFELIGAPASATQCISDCPSGQSVDSSNSNRCLGTCPTGFPTLSGLTCYAADCPPAFPTPDAANVAQCLGACPIGTTAFGTQCRACPAGNTLLANGQCCPDVSTTLGNCPALHPPGYTCAAGQWVPDLSQPAPARYYVFAPATAIASPTPADLSNPANYVRVEINRDRPMDFRKATSRTDCAGSVCTWEEEAQNFANWFTYYRTRLFSAIAVTSESLSNLTRDRGLDGLRLAYGSINYFPNGADPFNPPTGRRPATMTIDGEPSNGTIVRGVRPFTEVTPPPPPGSNDRRQEVFDWLFSLRAVASTPNREALDSVGRYFRRSDPRGPWIQPDGTLPPDPVTGTIPSTVAGRWSSNETPADHISCRRNYTILITDGEWTRAPWVPAAPQQPLVENTDTPLAVLSAVGPTHLRPDGSSHVSYDPARDLQFSTNAGAAGGTLSDIALYYWSRDLRPDLVNGIRPIDWTIGSQGNPAFWQHMVPYLIGYGISASRDTLDTRAAIVASAAPSAAPVAVAWPSVRLENRPSETGTIVTDRDTAPIACRYDPVTNPNPAPGCPIHCGYDPVTNPAGCGRVDDTMRAAFAARGNFLSAADVNRLSQGVAAAFTAIGEIEGTATALTGRSGTLRAGDRVFAASFRTNAWTGRVQSFDATAYFAGLGASTATPSVDSRFPAPASRNILTSTGPGTAVTFPTGAADFGNLSSAQQTALGNDPALAQWLRGDQSLEARAGGVFRNRPLGEIMGTIVNSQPLYSQAPDFGYNAVREPAAAAGQGAAYRTFVNANRSHRPARVFVGSNSGMLHAFDASGSPVTGASNHNPNYMNEVFAYVPRSVYGSLRAFATPGFSHRYLMDGPVVEGDVFTGGAWRTVVVGTTGAGPRGIFAIDVTQRSGSTATPVGPGNVLWDIDPSADSGANIEHVGHILQPGVIGSGRDGEWYYFVGNGFESQNDKARLLAIRIRDGAITAIDTDNAGGPDPLAASPSGRPNGLGGVTPVYDAERNIVAIYAGDRHGRLWKFDLSSTSRSSWSSTRLFTATTPTGEMQTISAAPRVLRHPRGGHMIVFGTGKLFERDDLADQSIQTVYGVWERTPSTPAAVARSSLRELALVDQVETVSGARYRQLTGTDALNWATDLGWYFNLTAGAANGERVIASPTEHGGFASITTFEPLSDGDPCKGGGRSFFYRLDVSGSFTRSPFAPVGPITALPPAVARNTVVGSELLGPSISQLQTLRVPAAATVLTSRVLDGAGFDRVAEPDRRPRDPCEATRGGGPGLAGGSLGTPQFSCPGSPLRVWRDLPRGPR